MHDLKYEARTIGIIVVAEQIGIEDTVYTLKRFFKEMDVSDAAVFTATGYATEIGDAIKNPSQIEEAREMARKMAACLK
ncbi:MAG: hypothetical protein QGI51_00360 [Dehalococcoidales bacterium]|nr:hypothetical protein [Dehalococcoidales bacterium]MDP6631942.1 hypothetical protein [Dehalococcoidales bacterium]